MSSAKLRELEAIYRAHHTFVWRIIRRLGVPEAAVDDAVQEVFVVVHRRREQLSWGDDPRPLLYGVARRVARRARERAAKFESIVPVDTLILAPIDLDRRLRTEEAADVVRKALDDMDETKRMTFMLVDVEGMSVTEVARCHEVNLNTAYARLRAARKLIQRAIERHRAKEAGEGGRIQRR